MAAIRAISSVVFVAGDEYTRSSSH